MYNTAVCFRSRCFLRCCINQYHLLLPIDIDFDSEMFVTHRNRSHDYGNSADYHYDYYSSSSHVPPFDYIPTNAVTYSSHTAC